MSISLTQRYQPFFRKVDYQGKFKKSWKLFGIYFTISNCRVKKRHACGYSRAGYEGEKLYRIKMKHHKRNNGRCPICGCSIAIERSELHHVLPYARFSDLVNDERNTMLLCHDCHREIHCNPFQNVKLMEAKAAELGIDLDERYNRQ